MKEQESFGDILFRRRKELGLTQSQLASRIGVQPNYIVYLEKGERRPSDRTLRRVAEALGLDKGDLYLAANPQVREFLDVDEDNRVNRTELPEGLKALAEDQSTRAALTITDDEIERVACFRFHGRATTAGQYASLILTMRYVFG
jgi:transcriptional regulator with XRE-family HTH domain